MNTARDRPDAAVARPPQHVLNAIREWALSENRIIAVYGAGSRFKAVSHGPHLVDYNADLDLILVVTQGPDSLSPTQVRTWRSALSIQTAFSVHLHIAAEEFIAEGTSPIFRRSYMGMAD